MTQKSNEWFRRRNLLQVQALMIAREKTCAEIKELRALSTAGQPSRYVINMASEWHKEAYCGERCKAKAGDANGR